ncbi:AMP-binding protein [Candidatus Dependentiae bacterium]|nr:AMP-binding protein [Candidatus Dependentiae bacterium]
MIDLITDNQVNNRKAMNCVVDLLHSAAEKFGAHPALTQKIGFRTITLTYAQLYAQARAMALLLQQQGLKKGDCVVIIAPNSPWWVVSYWGTMLAGGVIVPLNIQSTRDFAERIITQTDSSILIAWSRFLYEHPTGSDRSVTRISIELLPELLAAIDPDKFVPLYHLPEDLIEVMYTSGTTGDPKGVMLTNGNIMANIDAIHHAIQLDGTRERMLSILPLSHIFEQTIGMLLPLSMGVHIIYAHSPVAIVGLMQQYKITKLASVPEFLAIVYSRMTFAIEQQGYKQLFMMVQRLSAMVNTIWFSRILFWPLLQRLGGNLDTVVSGGAPLDPALERAWLTLGVHVIQGYGLTETSPCATTNTFDEHRYASVGKPLYNVQVRIADDGEIQIKGPSVFQGYYNNAAATAAAFTADGWFKTGDMGQFDADGYLYMRGRKKYMILSSGGQNVFPEDIEVVLNNIPGVKDSCVLGIARAGGKEDIYAVLLLDDNAVSVDDIVQQANSKLASFQQINAACVWPEADFPRSATRKVRKEEVRKKLGQLDGQRHDNGHDVTQLQRLLASVTGIAVEQIYPSSLLVKDLKLDSLTRVELVSRIELEFNKQIDEAAITSSTTVAQLQTMIDTMQAAAPRKQLAAWPRSWWARLLRPIIQYGFFLYLRRSMHVRVIGAENLMGIRQPIILMPNHISYWDSLLVARALPAAIRNNLSFAGAEDVVYDYWKNLSWLLELGFNVFRLPRTEQSAIRAGLENIGTMLDAGYNVVVFPEGKVSVTGALQPLKQGAGLLATQMGTMVVPIYIAGVRQLLDDPYALTAARHGTVTVFIGEPMQLSMQLSIAQATEQISAALQELAQRAADYQ